MAAIRTLSVQRRAALELALTLLLAAGAFVAAGLLPSIAWAAGTGAIARVICSVVLTFTGGIGILLGIIAICILGLTAALGRISWPVALTTVVGIAIIFGAQSILGLFGNASPCANMGSGLSMPQLDQVLCKVLTVMQGSVGASLATIAVCMLGVGALLGKVQWNSALTVIIGIIVLFSASSILQVLYISNNKMGAVTDVKGWLAHCGSPVADFGYFSRAMCGIAAYMSGKAGVTVAVIGAMGVQILALSAMFGRVSWGTAITVAVGIAILFGASSIVGLITRRNIACPVYGTMAAYNISVRPVVSAGVTDVCHDMITGDVAPCTDVGATGAAPYVAPNDMTPCGPQSSHPGENCELGPDGITWFWLPP